jgi:hypothetical protein
MAEFSRKDAPAIPLKLAIFIQYNDCLPDNNANGMISKIRKIELKRADALPPLLISK